MARKSASPVFEIKAGELFRFYYYKGKKTDYLVGTYGTVVRVYRKCYYKSDVALYIEINPWKTGSGYWQVELRINCKRVRKLVHVMVAETHLEGKGDIDKHGKEKNEVDHLDRNKDNFRADNLEWVSHTENMKRVYVDDDEPIF